MGFERLKEKGHQLSGNVAEKLPDSEEIRARAKAKLGETTAKFATGIDKAKDLGLDIGERASDMAGHAKELGSDFGERASDLAGQASERLHDPETQAKLIAAARYGGEIALEGALGPLGANVMKTDEEGDRHVKPITATRKALWTIANPASIPHTGEKMFRGVVKQAKSEARHAILKKAKEHVF